VKHLYKVLVLAMGLVVNASDLAIAQDISRGTREAKKEYL
jgi:hypothetical protein